MASTPDVPLQSRILDDKSPICIPFILSKVKEYQQQQQSGQRPFIIGLNGVQGVGKTTLVRALAQTLQEREGLSTLVVSIDDFYLTHADQLALAAAHPDNALVQYRGEPGTHDIPLLLSFLTSLTSVPPSSSPSLSTSPTPSSEPWQLPIPQYNKSLFSGLGDRAPPSEWPVLASPPQVLLLEGWLVGFRPLSPSVLQQKWSDPSSRTLHNHMLSHLEFINSSLAAYTEIWDQFDAFIHIDAEDLNWVYEWRLQQEHQLRMEKGVGGSMTDEQVTKFVDAYFPAYELYSEGVRQGVFEGDESKKGRQLRLVVGRDRGVQEKVVI
ncbi:putative kinase [Podospora australis]|uniref:Kinase n=1 Tax=Podospora australis TaxID=1536484 RepID=A0AAN6WVR3_9PEZI|nr:putative kinase [Podospora australis]